MNQKIVEDLNKLIADYFENVGIFVNGRLCLNHVSVNKSVSNPGSINLKIEGQFFQKYMTPAIPTGKAVLVDGMGAPVGVIENIGESKNHSDHEIVENFAGGKSFKYCRTCKTEVP